MPSKQTKNLDAYDVLRLEFAPPDTRLRRFLRRMAYVMTVFLVLEGVAVGLWGNRLPVEAMGRMVAMGVIAGTWGLLWVGYMGWLFEYCRQGFKRKKIWVAGAEIFPGDYSGKAAQAWAMAGMSLAVTFFALAMTPVFFLLFP